MVTIIPTIPDLKTLNIHSFILLDNPMQGPLVTGGPWSSCPRSWMVDLCLLKDKPLKNDMQVNHIYVKFTFDFFLHQPCRDR